MSSDHPPLIGADIIARGGWHPRYARVLAAASDGDYGIAIVDGNGDGAELEIETWVWDDEHPEGGRWDSGVSSGAGPLGYLGPVQTGNVGDAYFAYGRAPGPESVTIEFDGQLHQVPVGGDGVWAFIRIRADPRNHGFPSLAI
jgi:hypothetical protein